MLCVCAGYFTSSALATKEQATDAPAAPAAIIYDNGGLGTGANSNSGVAAPAGTQWSEAANPVGNTQQANTLAGVACSVTTTVFRCADDFNVPVGQTWTINQVLVFAYQTGFAGATSPITAGTLRIWNGRPGDAASTIIFGDTTTNRLASSTDSGFFRIFSSVVGVGAAGPTAPVTNRRVWQNNLTVSPALVLPAGNYWIDWNTTIGATTAHFAPPATISGIRAVPGQNARQFTGTAWVDVVDAGQAPTGAPVPGTVVQDFPFKLDGSVSGAPAIPLRRTLDFNGDNKSDLVIARATGAAAQATWYIQDSAGVSSATNWGLGVGFAGGDIATPEDFDGDGKTDIAVWRSDPTAANFFILQSSTSTLNTQQFGQAGDDPTVVEDYDGDGKADVAVFRVNGAGGPCGGTSIWYWRPSGTPATNFAYACWGTTGDKAYPGDYDGDGKADPSVVRNNASAALVIQNRTTAGARTVSFSNFADKFVSGDFDADNRSDLAAVRNNAGVLTWYFQNSGTGQSFQFDFGNATTDYVLGGDYDGDNKADFGLWRSGTGTDSGTFYIIRTFLPQIGTKFGASAASLAAPDYPVANYLAH
jgi:hypothetical protein